MRPKKPIRVSIEQVLVRRDGPTAIIEFADPACEGVNLTVGDQVAQMSDQQVVDVLNGVLVAQAQSLREWDNTVTEIPVGKPQIKFNRDTEQWLPQGEVRNQNYTQPGAALTNTCADGDLVRAALEKVGFKVTFVRDRRELAAWQRRALGNTDGPVTAGLC